jgi:hypothetical protein
MNRSAPRILTALALAALASGAPRVAGDHAALAAAAVSCACHHAGRAPCTCPRGAARTVRSGSCLSSCCRLPETARPLQSSPEPMILGTALVLPRPARRWSLATLPAVAPERADEPETPPPRLA